MVYCICEMICERFDGDIKQERDGSERILEAYTNREAAIAALDSWAANTDAHPYPGCPSLNAYRAVTDRFTVTYRCMVEVPLVK